MRTVSRAAALMALFVLVGCSGEEKVVTLPVTGKVMFKKTTPAAGALVVFHPVDEAFEKKIGGKPLATVKDDGTFTLTTKEENDGAPAGDYNVTVVWHKKGNAKMSLTSEGGSGPNVLNAKYGNPKSAVFKFSVKNGDKNEFMIEVD